VSTLPTLIQYSTQIPSQSNKARERNESNSNREGRSQIIPIADDMILYLKDPKNSTQTLTSHKHLEQSSRIQN
jgi:hypothetical protein